LIVLFVKSQYLRLSRQQPLYQDGDPYQDPYQHSGTAVIFHELADA